MTDRLEQQFGNYCLTQLLGQGGFADVYLAKHIHLETQAAVKVLNMRLTSANIEQFRLEARTVARLIHPNIVRVLDFGVQDNIPYLVMDYAPNGTLRQLHPKGTYLQLESIISYVKQVAKALQYAHDEKLIHRDIKPENLLVGRQNEILLSDFGIAVVAHNSNSQITQGLGGTIPYMAPEQIRGKPRPASDQYSLGIVVYEWLTGVRPFQGTIWEITTQHLSTPPPPFNTNLSISPNIEQIVMKALAKEPHQRFTTVRDFAMALEEASLSAKLNISAPSLSQQPVMPIISVPSNMSSNQPSIVPSLSETDQNFMRNDEALTNLPPSVSIPPLLPLDAALSLIQESKELSHLVTQQSTSLPIQSSQQSNVHSLQDQFLITPILPSDPLPPLEKRNSGKQTQQFPYIPHSQELLQQYPVSPQGFQQLVGYAKPQRTLGGDKKKIITNLIVIILLLVLIFSGVVGYVIVEQNGQNIADPVRQLAVKTSTSIVPSLQTPLITATVQTVPLGNPIISNVQYSEKADGTTSYTFTAQAVDEQQQPVHKAGITCKLWLTDDGKVSNNMPTDRLKAIDTLAQPFPKEVANALNFNSTTPQVQPCAAGQGNWNYTLSSALTSGTYYLVVLTDWSGVHYDWAWFVISIT